jgi:hypothetical protein
MLQHPISMILKFLIRKEQEEDRSKEREAKESNMQILE